AAVLSSCGGGYAARAVSLRQAFVAAWELLALRHKPLCGVLNLPLMNHGYSVTRCASSRYW
ncbi:hypothetical protein UA70_24865, partial [Raoultella planticola]